MKKSLLLLIIVLIYLNSTTVLAENTGRIINNKCSNNLKTLNEATKQLLENHQYELPQWRSFEAFYEDSDLYKHLKEKPISPTVDCRYFLVSLNKNDYQWCCDLHGVVNGDKTVSFMYHEHATVGKINSKYEEIEEYSGHAKTMLHWTNYQQTFTEYLKYNYNMNPITTIISIIGVLIIAFVVYRTIY